MPGMAGCGRCEADRLEALAAETGNWLDGIRTGMMCCAECGNKRCPKAAWHGNACTGSNEPGQPGSAYPATPGRTAGGHLLDGIVWPPV